MKVRIGDTVWSNDFGPGKIVSMSDQWCIYKQGTAEFALPWEDIYVEVEPESVCSQKEDHDLSD